MPANTMAGLLSAILDQMAIDKAEILAAIQSSQMAARPTVKVVQSITDSGATFPNYGRRRGEPVSGAAISDLEYYANGCRRTLDDPSKSRWHDKERALLAAIEREIARQTGGSADTSRASDGGGGFVDDEVPFAKMSDRVQ